MVVCDEFICSVSGENSPPLSLFSSPVLFGAATDVLLDVVQVSAVLVEKHGHRHAHCPLASKEVLAAGPFVCVLWTVSQFLHRCLVQHEMAEEFHGSHLLFAGLEWALHQSFLCHFAVWDGDGINVGSFLEHLPLDIFVVSWGHC